MDALAARLPEPRSATPFPVAADAPGTAPPAAPVPRAGVVAGDDRSGGPAFRVSLDSAAVAASRLEGNGAATDGAAPAEGSAPGTGVAGAPPSSDVTARPEDGAAAPAEEEGSGSEGEREGDARSAGSAERSAESRMEAAERKVELAEIERLEKRDREVRAHEQAHASVGGQYAGTPSYTFERGPDGVSYAVAGEVPIDASPVPGDPQATLRKAEQVRRAALAPAEPSAQDRKVAAEAARMAGEARVELAAVRVEERAQGREARGEASDADTSAEPGARPSDAGPREGVEGASGIAAASTGSPSAPDGSHGDGAHALDTGAPASRDGDRQARGEETDTMVPRALRDRDGSALPEARVDLFV